jgi:NAD(P)-dependent dehydrogenase (short-subunit alcohol dehydrogenase family)
VEEAGKAAVDDWFHLPLWKQSPHLRRACGPADWEACLVFSGDEGVGASLAEHLRHAGHPVVRVRRGEGFGTDGESEYRLRPGEKDDYTLLFQELHAGRGIPRHVVHCWNAESVEDPDAGACFTELMHLVQALGEHSSAPASLTVVGSEVFDVLGGEVTSPRKSLVAGLLRVVEQEYPHLACRLVDVPAVGMSLDALATAVRTELGPALTGFAVAYRGSHRWTQSVERVAVPAEVAPPLREGGTYLITGGLGGLGLVAARWLAGTAGVKLVLLGRSGLPDRRDWGHWLEGEADDRTAARIRAVLDLEATGAEVMVVRADVARRSEVEAALDAARQRFGPVHGVIHAAGVPGVGLIQLKDAASAAAVLAPKVEGTEILHSLVRGEELDFMVLFSSIRGLTGEIGQADYAAANAFLDAFARKHDGRERARVVAIDWDAWQWDAWQEEALSGAPASPGALGEAIDWNAWQWGDDPGPAASGGLSSALHARVKAYREEFGIQPDEGVEVIRRILAAPWPQVAISTRPWEVMLRTLHATDELLGEMNAADALAASRPRPELRTEFAAPRTSAEQQIASIWQGLFGIERVGVRDDFFELGGHSLLGAQLLARLREVFGVPVAISEIFVAPTVESQAVLVEERLLDQIEALQTEEPHALA